MPSWMSETAMSIIVSSSLYIDMPNSFVICKHRVPLKFINVVLETWLCHHNLSESLLISNRQVYITLWEGTDSLIHFKTFWPRTSSQVKELARLYSFGKCNKHSCSNCSEKHAENRWAKWLEDLLVRCQSSPHMGLPFQCRSHILGTAFGVGWSHICGPQSPEELQCNDPATKKKT